MKLSKEAIKEIESHKQDRAVLSGFACVVHHHGPNTGSASVVFPANKPTEHFENLPQAYQRQSKFNQGVTSV